LPEQTRKQFVLFVEVKCLNKKFSSSVAIALSLAFLLTLAIPFAFAKPAGIPRGTDVVYVIGQDKYYDTIVPIDTDKQLPFKGPFQQIIPITDQGVVAGMTQYGPGDPQYVGGRWWVDVNPNGYPDANDIFFLCPLRGPGRDSP
jgi:hypothetical protein